MTITNMEYLLSKQNIKPMTKIYNWRGHTKTVYYIEIMGETYESEEEAVEEFVEWLHKEHKGEHHDK